MHQKLASLTLITQRHREDVRHEINKWEVWKNEWGDIALFELCCPCCTLLEQALLANTMEQLNNFQAQRLLEGKFNKLRIPNCNQTLGKKQYWNTTFFLTVLSVALVVCFKNCQNDDKWSWESSFESYTK